MTTEAEQQLARLEGLEPSTVSELPSSEIEATGSLTDGILTVALKLGDASVTLAWPAAADGDEIDTLISAIYPATERVLDAISAAQGDDRG